jgi:hypothetical protein
VRGSSFAAGNSLRQSNLQNNPGKIPKTTIQKETKEGRRFGGPNPTPLTRWQVSSETTLVHLHTLLATCAHIPHGCALVAPNKLPTLWNNNTFLWLPRTTKPKTTEPWPKTREPWPKDPGAFACQMS